MWERRFRIARVSFVRHTSFASASLIVEMSIFVVSSSYFSNDTELLRTFVLVDIGDSEVDLVLSGIVPATASLLIFE